MDNGQVGDFEPWFNIDGNEYSQTKLMDNLEDAIQTGLSHNWEELVIVISHCRKREEEGW